MVDMEKVQKTNPTQPKHLIIHKRLPWRTTIVCFFQNACTFHKENFHTDEKNTFQSTRKVKTQKTKCIHLGEKETPLSFKFTFPGKTLNFRVDTKT